MPSVRHRRPLPRWSGVLALILGALASSCGSADTSADPPGHDAEAAPSITAPPQPRTVTAGQTASFSVEATGAAPLAYQWRRDDVPIPGATSAAYVTPATTAADDGARFTVRVSNAAGAATSGPATLTVRAVTSTCTRLGPTGDRTLTTTDGAGNARAFEVVVPASYPAGAPLAVTFVFHGAGGTSGGAKGFGLQDAPGAASSSIFVFPQGIPFQSYGVGWNDACSGYDMVFFDRMLAAVEAAYCVDPARVYVAGFSWGCDFVTALACCRGDRIRGVAAASCSDEFRSAADPTTYTNLPCPTQSGARIRFTHDVTSDGGYTAQQFATTSALYRAFDGCSSTASAVSPSPCVGYAGCRQPVVECAYGGLGHALPSGWAAESWSFLTSP